MSSSDQPKIIVDSDWKSQARAEKEKLAQTLETPKASPAPGSPSAAPGAAPADKSAPGPGEPVRFEEIISLLVSQALVYMGAFPDPKSGRAVVSLELSRVYIDMLAVLEEKTKGNLTPEEASLLSRTLNELRLEFVELSKALAKAVEEGRIKPTPGGGFAAGPMGGGPMGGSPGFGPGVISPGSNPPMPR